MRKNTFLKISSKDNQKIKRIINLKKNKDVFFVEGIRIINEMLNEKINIDTLIFSNEALNKPEINSIINRVQGTNCKLLCIKTILFNKICDTEEPQGIIAMALKEKQDISKTLKKINEKALIVLLDRINDPGNLGTIIRTCKAANVSFLIISKGSASIYNPKVIRASMGTVFSLNIVEDADLESCINKIKDNNVTVITTELKSSKSLFESNYNLPVCFVFGNEANGISDKVLNLGDLAVKLPILGNIESLNVAVSVGITLYDAINRFNLSRK